MRVTGLSRLVENYARKSCRAFPLEDKDMYIYTGQIGRGDAGESAARKKTRPFKRNWDRHPQGSCSPIAQSIDSLVFAKFELKLCVLDFFNE